MDNASSNPKQALTDRLQQSTNILVTVSANPSVDQLAACLGLTLWLNKADKHATAVFSGEVPSTLEFLQPEETLEKNTDSLRDFIIALDKSKADKLRYKVEDTVVKIFITPYRTSLSADDLEYSQGDFNVDTIIALGVNAQADLDSAITAHGRILHDATVATITTGNDPSELGTISWHDAQASSLSELVVELGNGFDQKQLDGQIATALLTGIVAETARFSNEKTTPQTMSISAQLMSAGANQQLVASKLDEPAPQPEPAPEATEATEVPEVQPEDSAEFDVQNTGEQPESNDTLEIEHQPEAQVEAEPVEQLPLEPQLNPESEPEQLPEPVLPELPLEPVNEDPAPVEEEPQPVENEPEPEEPEPASEPKLPSLEQGGVGHESPRVTEPPTRGGTLTANSQPEYLMEEPSSDPLSQTQADVLPMLDRPADQPAPTEPATELPTPQGQPEPPQWMPPQPWMAQPPMPATTPEPAPEQTADQPTQDASFQGETLQQIEQQTDSPHLQQDTAATDVDAARDEVMKAIEGTPDANPEPIQALNAQPIDLSPPAADTPTEQPQPGPAAFGNNVDLPTPQVTPAPAEPVEQPFTLPVPGALAPPPANPVPPTSIVNNPTAPPPVPPPLMPPGFPPAN